MAANQKARVVKTELWHGDVCHVICEMIEPRELGFVGGQYVIINSGRLQPNGKLGKRAYSIASSDVSQDHFEIVVKRIPLGVGSGFIHELQEGDTFEFSGPWGKYKPAENMSGERVLVIATDTGITAALGLLRAQALKSCLAESLLIWLLSSETYFIPDKIIRQWLPPQLEARFPVLIPPVNEEVRNEAARYKMDDFIKDRHFTKIYLSGDGYVLRELKDLFLKKGYAEPLIFTESFFHHESLKSPSLK